MKISEHKLHLLNRSPDSDKLKLLEFGFTTLFYHVAEEFVEYLPGLVFQGISREKFELLQLRALASEHLKDVGRQACDVSAVCKSEPKLFQVTNVDYLS